MRAGAIKKKIRLMAFPGSTIGPLSITRGADLCVWSAVFSRTVYFWTVPELWGIKIH